MIDHLIRFVVLIAIKDKEETTNARHPVEHVFSIFGTPETLHSDQVAEFENQLVEELQSVFGYKTRTSACRPQGNSVQERMHSTVHNMMAMYSSVAFYIWADLLPFIQLVHNTSYSFMFTKPLTTFCSVVRPYYRLMPFLASRNFRTSNPA